MEQPNPLAKLREPLVTRADSDKSIEAFERKRQEKAERQKNEIIDAATAYRKFEPISLVSLSDNAKMLSLSLLFILCHLLTGVLYFHHIVGWPIDGESQWPSSHLAAISCASAAISRPTRGRRLAVLLCRVHHHGGLRGHRAQEPP